MREQNARTTLSNAVGSLDQLNRSATMRRDIQYLRLLNNGEVFACKLLALKRTCLDALRLHEAVNAFATKISPGNRLSFTLSISSESVRNVSGGPATESTIGPKKGLRGRNPHGVEARCGYADEYHLAARGENHFSRAKVHDVCFAIDRRLSDETCCMGRP